MSSAATGSLAAVAASLLEQLDTVSGALFDALAAELPELVVDPRVRELLRGTVLHNVASALRIVGGDGSEGSAQAPPVAFEFAKRLAQLGIPLTTMLRAYRLGQAAFQQTVLRTLGATEISAAEMMEASVALSAIAFEFIDAVSEQVVAVYQRERDAWLGHRNAIRLGQVQSLLAGRVADAGVVEAELGLSLAGPVLGAVLWFDQGQGLDVEASMEQQVRRLAEALGGSGRGALSVAADDLTVWAWLPGCFDAEVRAGYAPAAGIHVALGRPGRGVGGFRRTHRQARQVHALSLAAPGRSLLRSEDVGPLGLIGASIEDVRGWVGTALGALGGAEESSARLRETVWCYLSHDSSLNAAAGALHLHKNTIQYRLRKAEELRGRDLGDGRLELEVALLAWQLLGDAVLGDWSEDQNVSPT